MKIRAIAAAAAALVILAACGGSETSKPETRTKNGALIQQTIPQNTSNNIIFDIPQTSNINNIDNNLNNNIIDIPSNTTNKTCAQGGLCVVGDIGPGGGIVFYAEKTLQPWGQYMEVSQKPLDPNFDTMWCDVAPTQAFPKSDALGNGLNTTTWYARDCKRGLLRLAADLVQGGYDDWSLPTLADAKQLYLARDITKIDGQWHYTATPNLTDGKQEAWAVYMVEEQTMSMNPLAGLAGRAIRTFAPLKVPSCANGDACKVGDVGPGGGLVFYAADTPQPWGQYMEVSQTTLDPRFDMMWCDTAPKQGFPKSDALGNGLDTTTFFARDCTRGLLRMAVDLVQGGKDDWSLPTIADLKQLYLVSKQLRIEGQWHYSATPELNTNQPLAQYMVDGTVKSMNPLAGFAGRAIRTFGQRATALTTSTSAAITLPPQTNPPTTTAPPPPPPTTTATTTPPTTVAKPAVTTTAAPVPTSAPKATTTSSVTATSCAATGRTCKVGDIGPGGGIVFYAAPTPQPWGQYIESLKSNYGPATNFCDNKYVVVAKTGIGTGRENTVQAAKGCRSGAALIAGETINGRNDWALPSRDEAIELYRQRALFPANNSYIFTSSTMGSLTVWTVDMASGNPYPMSIWSQFGVRPVRNFGPTGPAVAATTITKPGTCGQGGACRLGDTGPGGGIVFYANPTREAWGQYLEVAPGDADKATTQWCGSVANLSAQSNPGLGGGQLNTSLNAGACLSGVGRTVARYASAGKSDWFVPSSLEAYYLMDYTRLHSNGFAPKLIKQTTGVCYWTSSSAMYNSRSVALYMEDRNGFYSASVFDNKCFVRPIRAF